MSENDVVNEKERENQQLLKTNSMLTVQLNQAKKAKDNMESQLIRVFEEAHELKEFEQTKG